MRSFIASAVFALVSLVAVARCETIVSIESAAPFGPPVNLDPYPSFGVWGVNDVSAPFAQMMVGSQVGTTLGKFGPEGTTWQSGVGSGLFQYTLDGGSFYGGIAAVPVTGSPAWTGIEVTLQPEGFPSTLPVPYSLWMVTGFSRGVWAEVFNSVGASSGETYIPARFYGKLLVTTDQNSTVRLTMDGGGNPDDGTTMVLGAVTAGVQAVPEPECLLTVALVAPILALACRRRNVSEQANQNP